MPERTHFPVGSYTNREIREVIDHAHKKGLGYETVEGPQSDFMLADGTKITIPKNETAVVLITNDIERIHSFWDGFKRPPATK